MSSKIHATLLTVLQIPFSLFILHTFTINVMVHEVHTIIHIQICLQWLTHCTFSGVQLEKVTNIQEGQANL